MLTVMSNTSVEIRPTSYSFKLVANRLVEDDSLDKHLTLSMKIQQTNVMRLVELIPLLDRNSGSAELQKFRLPVEVPVTVTYIEEDGHTELSARMFWIEIDGKDVTLWVDGYARAVRLSAAHLDVQIRALFKEVTRRDLSFTNSNLPATPTASDGLNKQFSAFAVDVSTATVSGQRKVITLCWNDRVVVLGEHYRKEANPRPASNCDFPTYLNQQYTRNNRAPMKVFVRESDGFWVLAQPGEHASIARLVSNSYEFAWI